VTKRADFLSKLIKFHKAAVFPSDKNKFKDAVPDQFDVHTKPELEVKGQSREICL